jgi:hypothetical protein
VPAQEVATYRYTVLSSQGPEAQRCLWKRSSEARALALLDTMHHAQSPEMRAQLFAAAARAYDGADLELAR